MKTLKDQGIKDLLKVKNRTYRSAGLDRITKDEMEQVLIALDNAIEIIRNLDEKTSQ